MDDILGNQILAVLVSLSDSMRDVKDALRELQSSLPQPPSPSAIGYMHDVGLPAVGGQPKLSGFSPNLDDAGLGLGLPDVVPRL